MNKLVACFFLIVSGICCGAQTESLLIGPGDQLGIQVLEAPELAQHARVTDAGNLPLLVGGLVKVAGLTPSDAAIAVQQALVDGHYLLHPHVAVTVEQYATQSVTVIGQVLHAGSIPISTPRPVLDIIGLAGGLSELADRRITIQRRASKELVEYFLSNKASTALDTNILVYPGDIVLVPKIDIVYVMGDLARPGAYPMATNDGKLSMMEAIALAGNQNHSAVPNSTRLIRKQQDGTYVELKVALSNMEKGKTSDIALQPDDIVYVPFSYIRNMGTNIAPLVAAAATAVVYRY